ncbi:MAG TPA: glycosyltransferase [Burkholderiales bacterium]|nr:glycosyltransferase [Burkholderiales bacterium]
MTRLLLHAPSVHTGGGLVLLKDLLGAPNLPLAWISVDARAINVLTIPAGAQVRAVRRSAIDRFAAESDLHAAARPGDVVLCFHGLPPLRRNLAHTVVFLQNRNYLGVNRLREFAGWTRWRIALERLQCKMFRRNVDEYLVQTPSMARLVSAWHRNNPAIRVVPFLDTRMLVPARVQGEARRYDFMYVADGEAHKNHHALLQAWIALARDGCKPSLALTLGVRHAALAEEIARAAVQHGLSIENLGELRREQVIDLYAGSRALIYPSMSESFSIPLIEAASLGLPIVASELDYVRDVVVPAQTFDPASPVSIARAVKRFLGVDEPALVVSSPAEFTVLLGKNR